MESCGSGLIMEEMDDSVLLDVINKALEKDFLCIPPYYISAFDVKKIYKEVVDGKEIKHHVTSRVLNHHFRAHQMACRYRVLPIFEDIWRVIDVGTISIFKNNVLASYLTLMPVVEAISKKWYDEEVKSKKGKFVVKNFLDSKASEFVKYFGTVKAPENSWFKWKQANAKFVSNVIKNALFLDTDNGRKKVNYDFNRNEALHYLTHIKGSFKSVFGTHLGNICRLLLLIDLIADMYFWLHSDEYMNNPIYKGTDIADFPFSSTYNSKLEEAYLAFYNSCFRYGLEHDHINVFNGILSKTDISDDEIKSVVESSKHMDTELDLMKDFVKIAKELK